MLSPLIFASTAVILLTTGVRVHAEPVEVKLGKATIVGDYNATTGVDAFLGVKYADSKRFERGTRVEYSQEEVFNATIHAPSCVQIKNATGYDAYGVVEDCLYLEVYRPHTDKFDDKLPILVWTHGGGGNYGAANAYLGYNFVTQSLAIDKPVIVVTINYRLAVWGLLGGKEASENNAVNLALYDQRTAFEWVQENIESFGGDKTKVTLWGQSAGSMDTHYHFLDEESDLFRAAILESGNVNSVPALDTSFYQDNYDAIVKATGCSDKEDTLKCLKGVDLSILQNAVNTMIADPKTYSTRPWGLIIDGDIIPDAPSKLLAQGKFAKKPFIHGDVLDEGTVYPTPVPMETVEDMWALFENDYLNKDSTWISNEDTKATILALYPADPAEGSPFGTKEETFGYGLTFKRAAALYGDIRFQAPRRSWFSDALKNGVNGWAYQLTQFTPSKYPAAYGVYHSTDLAYVFLEISPSQVEYYNLAKEMVNYWITFAYNLDPNCESATAWPSWGAERNLMNFAINNTAIVPDTFRRGAIAYLNLVQDQFGNPR